jgi:proline-specific peptidase
MEVRESGSGTSRILLVPGGPSLPLGFYRELSDELARSSRVVTYRQRGTYPDLGGDFPRNVEELTDELETALDEVPSSGEGPAPILLGHSMGGAAVIEALCRRNDVSGGIVISGFSSGRMLARGIADRVADLPPEFHRRYAQTDRHDAEGINALVGEFWYPRHFCRVPWPDSFVQAAGQVNSDYMKHFIGPNLFEPDGAVMDWDREDGLDRVSTPTLFISGIHDYFRVEDLRAMHHAVSGSSLWISESASHSPWIEDPEATFATINQFLGTLS